MTQPVEGQVLTAEYEQAKRDFNNMRDDGSIAQDQGALQAQAPSVTTEGTQAAVLAEMLAWVDAMTKKHGDPLGNQYEQGVNDHGFRIRGKIIAMQAAIAKGGAS